MSDKLLNNYLAKLRADESKASNELAAAGSNAPGQARMAGDANAATRRRLSGFLAWQQNSKTEGDYARLLKDYRDHLSNGLGHEPTSVKGDIKELSDFLSWSADHGKPSTEASEDKDADPNAADPNTTDPGTYIVGIGASAGGLEALERFFGSPDIDPNLAYVVVQHLSPDFKSMMPDILGRVTRLPLKAVEDDMQLEAGTVYLNTPRSDITLDGDCFRVTEAADEVRLHLPIDSFFSSLAARGAGAIGVVLSGTGRDGSEGAIKLRASGGLVLTQDTRSALFSSMPESAAARAPAHYTLTPDEMPGVIGSYLESGGLSVPLEPEDAPAITAENAFSYLLSLLQRAYKIDFSQYKNATLERRVQHRMAIEGESQLEPYIYRLQTNSDELDALYRDLLVDVTEFFRDTAAFKLLRTEVIPKLVAAKAEGESLRVWSAACASGEEAYSLAILFFDEIVKQERKLELKIFATDAHRDSVVRAGRGHYPLAKLKNVPPELRETYFEERGDGYSVNKRLRQTIIFAPHDLLSDGSFSNLDFVSCRNMLIYLRPEAQLKALSLFTNALNKDGVLFLGSSEHLGNLREHYRVLNDKWRVYQKKTDVAVHTQINLPRARPTRPQARGNDSAANSAERKLLRQLVPSGFVVTASGNLVEILGDAQDLLRLRAGRVDLNLFKLLGEPASTSLKSGFYRAQTQHDNLLSGTSRVKVNALLLGSAEDEAVPGVSEDAAKGAERPRFDVTIVPLLFDSDTSGAQHYVLQVEPSRSATDTDADTGVDTSANTGSSQREEDRRRLSELEHELEFTRESLQASLEEVETTNEELQSTNEELIASNEELQSTNEELSSVNEELITVNAEFQNQNRRLNEVNSDLENLLRNTQTIALFLDHDLKLRMITPTAYDVFGLVRSDLGRPITQFAPFVNFGAGVVSEMSQQALGGERVSRTITLPNDAVPNDPLPSDELRLQVTALPYTTASGETDGAVLRFIDVTEAEADARAPLQERVDMVERLQQNVPGTLYVYDTEQDANIYATSDIYALLGYSPEDVKQLGAGILAQLVHPDDLARLNEHHGALARSSRGETLNFNYRMKNAAGDFVWLNSRDSVYRRTEDGGVQSILGYANLIDANMSARDPETQPPET